MKRKFSEEFKRSIKFKKEEIFKEKLFEDKNKDEYYKKLISIITEEDKKYENDYINSAKNFELDNLFGKKKLNDQKNLLEKTNLPINEKINPIIFNIEKFDSIKSETDKLINAEEIDINTDFSSIIGNLFITLYNKEKMNLNSKDFFYLDYFESNLHKNSNLLEFIIDIPIIKNHSKGKLEKFLINLELKSKKNDFKEIMNIEYIDEFQEIMELDNYFTLIRNADSYKVTLLLAEIFTENSKNFQEESLYWIKYNLTLGKIHDFPEFQCRSVILACIYLMDNTTNVNILNKLDRFDY